MYEYRQYQTLYHTWANFVGKPCIQDTGENAFLGDVNVLQFFYLHDRSEMILVIVVILYYIA